MVAIASCARADGSGSDAQAVILGGERVMDTGFRSAPVPRSLRQSYPGVSDTQLMPGKAREISLKTVFLQVDSEARRTKRPRATLRAIRAKLQPVSAPRARFQQLKAVQTAAKGRKPRTAHVPPHHVRFQQLKARKTKRVVVKRKVAAKSKAKRAKAKTKARVQTGAQARAEAKAELRAAAEVLSELSALAEAAAAAQADSQASEGSTSGSGEGSEDSGPVYILPLAPMSWATLPQGSGSPGGGAPSDTPGQPMSSSSVGASQSS